MESTLAVFGLADPAPSLGVRGSCDPLVPRREPFGQILREEPARGEEEVADLLDDRFVFVLGAGASRHANAPLMSTFLQVARSIGQKLGPSARSPFDLVFKAISMLQRAQAKSELDLQNLETMYGAFQMAQRLRLLPNLSNSEIEWLPSAMSSVIATTLDEAVHFPADNQLIRPTEGYGALGHMIRDLGIGNCSVITFNYDIALDYSLLAVGVQIDYGLDSDSRCSDGVRLPVLKLHGSLNWCRCAKCGHIEPLEGVPMPRRLSSETVLLPCAPHLALKKHCNVATETQPVIVPPTWDKGQHHNELCNVWRRAAHELSRASHIFVLGYSLPSSDMFFRYLYALGTIGDALIRSFWVCDINAKVHERFDELLSPFTRREFHRNTSPFVRAINEIGKALDLKFSYGQDLENQSSVVQLRDPNCGFRIPESVES